MFLNILLTHVPGGGTHHGLQLKLRLQLGGGRQVEDPVVVDQSHQGPGLNKMKFKMKIKAQIVVIAQFTAASSTRNMKKQT